jgi:hypothetical protein
VISIYFLDGLIPDGFSATPVAIESGSQSASLLIAALVATHDPYRGHKGHQGSEKWREADRHAQAVKDREIEYPDNRGGDGDKEIGAAHFSSRCFEILVREFREVALRVIPCLTFHLTCVALWRSAWLPLRCVALALLCPLCRTVFASQASRAADDYCAAFKYRANFLLRGLRVKPLTRYVAGV